MLAKSRSAGIAVTQLVSDHIFSPENHCFEIVCNHSDVQSLRHILKSICLPFVHHKVRRGFESHFIDNATSPCHSIMARHTCVHQPAFSLKRTSQAHHKPQVCSTIMQIMHFQGCAIRDGVTAGIFLDLHAEQTFYSSDERYS